MFVEVKSRDFRTRTHNRARKVTANVQLTRAYHRAHFDMTIYKRILAAISPRDRRAHGRRARGRCTASMDD